MKLFIKRRKESLEKEVDVKNEQEENKDSKKLEYNLSISLDY